MSIRKFQEQINKIKTFIKLPNGDYSDDDNAFIKNFIIKYRELIKPLSKENRDDFNDVAKNYKKNIFDFTTIAESLLNEVKPIYNKKQFTDTKLKSVGWGLLTPHGKPKRR